MRDVAKGKISVLLFTSWYEIIKSYRSIKLTRSKPFRLYLIEKTIGGGKGKWSYICAEVIN